MSTASWFDQVFLETMEAHDMSDCLIDGFCCQYRLSNLFTQTEPLCTAVPFELSMGSVKRILHSRSFISLSTLLQHNSVDKIPVIIPTTYKSTRNLTKWQKLIKSMDAWIDKCYLFNQKNQYRKVKYVNSNYSGTKLIWKRQVDQGPKWSSLVNGDIKISQGCIFLFEYFQFCIYKK